MEDPILIPARMLNEMAYCPRLFALEFVHGELVPCKSRRSTPGPIED